MIIAESIGYAAAVVGTMLMLPQVVKSFKTKKVEDLSWGMAWLYVVNCALWLTYGILIQAMPVMLCNFFALIIGMILLTIKYRYQ